MFAEFIDTCLIFSSPVEVGLRMESYLLEHDGPGVHPILGYEFAVRIGERVLSTCSYNYEQGEALMKASIFADPVRLALSASKSPGREKGLLRVAISAAPTTPSQEAEMMDLDRSLPNGLGLWTLPEETVGVDLGHRWLPAGPDVLAPIGVGPGLADRIRSFETACRPFFDRILFGDPSAEARRLLDSIPGIGDEVGL